MTTINTAIIDYNKTGLVCLPATKKTKKVALREWEKYQKQPPSADEIHEWSNRLDLSGICLVCGTDANLEIIDFDNGGECFKPWIKLVPQELFDKLVIERTQRGGFHVLYKCESKVDGSQKLAQRKIDKVGKDDDEIIVLIETRGEGGYCLVSPGDGYVLKQGNIRNLPTLTPDEREDLLSYARSFNEIIKEVVVPKVNRGHNSKTEHFDDENNIRPGMTIIQKLAALRYWLNMDGYKNLVMAHYGVDLENHQVQALSFFPMVVLFAIPLLLFWKQG